MSIEIGRDSATTGSTIWFDDPSLIIGSSAFLTLSNNVSQQAWFGRPSYSGGNQVKARFQYPTFYYKALNDNDVREQFRRYMGDTGIYTQHCGRGNRVESLGIFPV